MAKDKEKETMDKKGGVGKKNNQEDEIPELPEIEIPDELITMDESIRSK